MRDPNTLLAALLMIAAACAREQAVPPQCALQRAAIFNGSEDAGALELHADERRSIIAIESDGEPACTGVVVQDGWALTAAHCAAFPELRVVRDDERLTIDAQHAHPELDAMLLEVGTPRDAEPIDPYFESLDEAWIGEEATLAGLGLTEAGETGELRFVREPIVDVTREEIWVDGEGESGACIGDSGGPLLVADGAGRARVAGVLDRGSADCLGIDVYVHIAALHAWLREYVAIDAGQYACPP